MRRFIPVWVGQLLSMMGTQMTNFVLAIWLWQQTGEATALVLVGVIGSLSGTVAIPIAGPIIDRFSRKAIIVVADSRLALTTLSLLLLVAADRLAVWHIYVAFVAYSFFGLFHALAFTTSITLVIPKEHYTRANSLMAVARYASTVSAPALAAALIAPLGIAGIMLIDVATFLIGIGTLLPLPIPRVVDSQAEEDRGGWRTITLGFRYIFARPPLRALLLVLLAFGLAGGISYPLYTPMILARTGGNQIVLGLVESTLGIGGIVGGIVVTVWGGFKRKIHGVLLGFLLTGLLGNALMGLGRGLPVWLLAAVCFEIFSPLAFSSNEALWQAKVSPQFQGRVFAARELLTTVTNPIVLLATGLLADHVFEPGMQPEGALAPLFGGLVGTGPGAGMALLMIVGGSLAAVAAMGSYLIRSLREIDTLLPDHAVPTGATPAIEAAPADPSLAGTA
jgi:DHA3 family macrolide efflux protein-like MFS transporter